MVAVVINPYCSIVHSRWNEQLFLTGYILSKIRSVCDEPKMVLRQLLYTLYRLAYRSFSDYNATFILEHLSNCSNTGLLATALGGHLDGGSLEAEDNDKIFVVWVNYIGEWAGKQREHFYTHQ